MISLVGTYKSTPSQLEIAIPEAIKQGYRLFGTFSFSGHCFTPIDTATVYRNEEAVGKLLKKAMKENNLNRSNIFITSKLGNYYLIHYPFIN